MMAQLQSKENLIHEITRAFEDIKRGDGVTLHQAIALDDRLNNHEIMKARNKDQEKNWQELELSDLSAKESALCFLDAEGFRYYLPAFMIAALEGHVDYGTLFFHLTRVYPCSLRESSPDKVVAKYCFNTEHVRVISIYLRFVIDDMLYELEAVERWEAYVNPNSRTL